MPTSKEKRAATLKRYDEAHRDDYKGYYFKLNKKTDPELIAYLDSIENKQGFIKDLIREHMKSGN